MVNRHAISELENAVDNRLKSYAYMCVYKPTQIFEAIK